MSIQNFPTAAVLADIKAIDERYPGSMKNAGIIAMLSSLVTLSTPSPFDPNSIYGIVNYIDELLPGSMKKAAMVYLLAQISASAGVLESGIAQLSGGSATVGTANVSATTPIMLSYLSLNNNVATVGVVTVTPGVSFVIHSSNSGDSNQVSWAILKP